MPTVTLTRQQRDSVYEWGLELLIGADAALWSAINAEEWSKADGIALRLSDFLRVVNGGLGWGPHPGESITLSAPADVLVRWFDAFAPEVGGRVRRDLEVEIAQFRLDMPKIRHQSQLEVTPDQQRFLVREILTRLTELDGLARCLQAEEWSDMRAYAEEFSDLLRFMAEDLHWRPPSSGILQPIAPPDVVHRSIKYLIASVGEARRVSETHAREAEEEAKEFQEIEDRFAELLSGPAKHRGD